MTKEITQSIIAIMVVGGALYANIAGLPGGKEIIGIAGVVIGFYFKDGITALGRAFKSVKK